MPEVHLNRTLPLDPLEEVFDTADFRRRLVSGILESYNSNYDFLVESIQNAVDALEDAQLAGLGGPFHLEMTVDLRANTFAVLDTGVGMTHDEVILAYKPHVSFKNSPEARQLRGAAQSYRGYKGVGLTFLAYGTDHICLHSKKDGSLTKTRMQYGRAWAENSRDEPARVDADPDASPLEGHPRGTYVKVHFSPDTRPRSLAHIGPPEAWGAIIRTRTAAGQILLGRDSVADMRVSLHVIAADGTQRDEELTPEFILPHTVERQPAFRFLDLPRYYEAHQQQAEPPEESRRQDGVYLAWDSDRIREELIEVEREKYRAELAAYNPHLYAFVPYQGSVWAEVNRLLCGVPRRTHLSPGLVIAVNRQRLADVFEMEVTRYETFSRNVFALVHFDNAIPDQGRKTLQDEVLDFAKAAANRAVQYLARQRAFLRPAGEAPTPLQRQVERDHQDWVYNVRTHAGANPLHIPPIAYASTPLTEQDVVGLFHQFCTLGVFPGIRVFATSQVHTYDCLVRFGCPSDTPGLTYQTADVHPLGVAPFVLGGHELFESQDLTLEFKNNIDALIVEVEDVDRPKAYNRIDICVCWSRVDDAWAGYEFSEVTEQNLEQRRFPGVTHLLHRDGEAHVIQVIMLAEVVEMVRAGRITIRS